VEVVATVADLRTALAHARAAGRDVGLVPTMGYLHDGHASLIRAAAAACGFVVMTSFVNPLQFAAGEDLDAYPSDPDGDERVAAEAGADLIFRPSVDQMYPRPMATTVSVAGLGAVMEGASRPTHFDGVTTVVAKLFSLVGECRAYFGEKDFQQLAIVRRMASDLSMPVEVVGCPIRREPDGLAMSSRNVYLTPEERSAAPVLHRALLEGAAAIAAGETDADVVRRRMANVVGAEPLAALDYVEVADPETLEPLVRCDAGARLFGAARFGRARLIDNVAAAGAAPVEGGAA
jgi:pantoate--beta-alanine ligase